MLDSLQKDIAGEAYMSALPVMEKVVKRFMSNFGGDFDDYMSHLNGKFFLLIESHKEERGSFLDFVRFKCYYFLLDFRSMERKYRGATTSIELPNRVLDCTEGDWTEELSEQDLLVVKYALSFRGSRCPLRIKRELRKLGWSRGQIADAFWEIKTALNRRTTKYATS